MRKKTDKAWPADCLWPEPYWDGKGDFLDVDLVAMQELDEEGQELLDVKEYMDRLVECGRLHPDYSLNEEYDEEESEWEPELGADYWDDGFEVDLWEDDLIQHVNLLKIAPCDPETDPVSFVFQVTGYRFINENILRQAFTRRAFGIEYGLGDCEELEFYGDAVLNTVVSHELYRRFSEVGTGMVEKPFRSLYAEGDLSKMRAKFVSRDHLAARAAELGLERYILYGPGEQASDSAREDMMEALIGAVAADSDWDWSLLADVVDRLIRLQLEKPDELVKKSAYEQLNSWHQKRFGHMPEYTVDRNRRGDGKERYDCALRYLAPENDRGVRTSQRIDIVGAPTRSAAREEAAEQAMGLLMSRGLWKNLSDAGLKPELDSSINQLQELYQKKYLEAAPVYAFEDRTGEWFCRCIADGVEGWGRAAGKTAAKKKAAYMALVRLLEAAGICEPAWREQMLRNMTC
ncbi:MAG: hypothetical protein IJI45_19515 [Anaerolineaceae bacterium]|nr:hypothetical protein [Anaerolineaceae bacterium]